MEEFKMLTQEELHELTSWFENYELPDELQLDKATYIPQLSDTVKRLLTQSEINYNNPKMQGCIILLHRIKVKLESLSHA